MVGIFSLAVALGAATCATPVIAQTELIVNGSFEDPDLGGDWSEFDVITGWTAVSGCGIEIGAAGIYGVTGQDGLQVCELDSDCNTEIRQTVATTPGCTYTLTFRTAKRAGTDDSTNQVNVFWGGTPIDSINPTWTEMQTHTYTVTATGPSMDLDFAGGGDEDTLGSMLDAVSLKMACKEWTGVLQPINADNSSIFKAGSTIPVKFQLTGASAGYPGLVAHISCFKISNNVVGSVNEAATNVGGDTGNTFRYDPTSDQYIYNWTTKGLTAGTYRIVIDLGDCCTHTVDVMLK